MQPTATHHRRLRRASLVASVGLTVLLIAAKLVAWLLGGSVAMLSSLLDSSLDLLSSMGTGLSIYHATRPADHNHRFGHEKAEPLAAFAQSIFISASAIFVVYEALNRLYNPRPLEYSTLGIVIMVVSTIGLIAVISLQSHVVNVTGSMAIEAESLNYRGDLLLNLSVIGALALTELTGVAWIDPVFGLGIAGLLFHNSLAIGRRCFAVLMDEELPAKAREEIRQTILEHPKVLGVHDLRTRHGGQTTFIEMHLELDGDLSLTQSHDIATEVEVTLRDRYNSCQVLVHQEPFGLEDHKIDQEIGTP